MDTTVFDKTIIDLISNGGALVILAFVIVYVTRFHLPRLFDTFERVLKEQRVDFLDALKEHSDAEVEKDEEMIKQLKTLNNKIEMQTRVILLQHSNHVTHPDVAELLRSTEGLSLK